MKTMTVFGYYHRNQRLVDLQAAQAHKIAMTQNKTVPVDWDFRRFIDNCNRLFR